MTDEERKIVAERIDASALSKFSKTILRVFLYQHPCSCGCSQIQDGKLGGLGGPTGTDEKVKNEINASGIATAASETEYSWDDAIQFRLAVQFLPVQA